MISYKTFVLNGLQVNCFLVFDDVSKECYVIDPAWPSDQLRFYIEDNGYSLKGILMTHAHGDHHMGLKSLKEAFDVPVYLHASDVGMAQDAKRNHSTDIFGVSSEFTPEVTLQDGMKLPLGAEQIRVLHTPGHSKGSVGFYVGGLLFSGDTLFQGSIGRTDLEGGDYEQIIKSIKNQYLKLPEDTVVLPGHGGDSTIGREKLRNPYLR